MAIDFRKHKDDLMFIPLGGTDEIGLNFYLYHYKGKWIIVDLGLGFADYHYPGVEILVPDIEFLDKIKKDLLGIVITHAHEDHIGAIQYLWPEIRVPIYATKFTNAVLKSKLTDVNLSGDVKIHEVEVNGKVQIGPFDLEFVNLTHSIPEMHGILFRTDKGNVFHTGDWKFDDKPVIGNPIAKERLKAIGDEGVLALICDSTNIFNYGVSGSEGDLQRSLCDLIGSLEKGAVVVTTFASNVGRLASLMQIADKVGRKIMFAGTSLWRMYHAALDTGYLEGLQEPLHPKEFSKHARADLLIVATGCQGERFAATTKLAKVEHPDIRLNKDDTVIFASKIIPGNETKIFELFNIFCKNGIEVLTEKDHFVHVSGHPSRDEVEEMYKLIRPQYAIPMHGQTMHIHEHCNFVKEKKLAKPVQLHNGAVLKLAEDALKVIGEVQTGYLAVDGNFILPSDSEILQLRRRMRDHGLVVITLLVDKRGTLLKTPQILAPGVLDSQDDVEYYEKLGDEIRDFFNIAGAKSETEIETRLRNITKRFFKNETAKEPRIFVQVILMNNK